MMSAVRVLVATTPGWGHVSPVLPVAEALRARGHELVWVTAPDAAASLAARGFVTHSAGMSIEERLPRAAALLADRVAGLPPSAMRAHAFTVHFALLAAPACHEGLADTVERLRPEVVLREPSELASAVLARRLGIPVATVGFGAFVPEPARAMADEALAPLADVAALGGSDRVHLGDLYLHPMPASMDGGELPPVARRVRPALPTATSGLDDRLRDLGSSRPAVYATFGTEFGPRAPWAAVLAALGSLAADVVVTTGSAGLPADVVAPANVQVFPYVDQALLLERVRAVLSHGGSGTVLGAASAGVPQVCAPLGADQFENTQAVVTSGVGVGVPPDRRDADTIAAALRTVLDDPSFGHAAAGVAAEIAGAADPTVAAAWIEELTAASR